METGSSRLLPRLLSPRPAMIRWSVVLHCQLRLPQLRYERLETPSFGWKSVRVDSRHTATEAVLYEAMAVGLPKRVTWQQAAGPPQKVTSSSCQQTREMMWVVEAQGSFETL
ncbi:hypothetical protein PHSY_003403 [Pseudozyma hubeiensis SY62]|uniref:Uncharacterized protein n=1 Tax=Pseudozyma hubeiensis (strain SY62) TaxID=1305764 RepID=R9P3B9_PSEHS|nr:hypothetical protein PHSY_003403 [Pseudozyma hubeiensis SY62]GAC95826.1 hypothetical protein PHSY_003403 [Pseudozyma hubeiensis SY62]